MELLGSINTMGFYKKGYDLGYVIREDHTYHHLHDVARDFDNFKGADTLRQGMNLIDFALQIRKVRYEND